jgi:hypothetical protein
MWIESPCHSRRTSEGFTQREIAAVDETAADRSVFGDDNTKETEPETVDSPTIKDQYQTVPLLSRETESFTLVAP